MTDPPLKPLHQEFMGYSRFTRQVSPNTLRGYQSAFDLLLKRYPDITTAMLSPELLSGFFEWLQMRERIVGRGALRQGVKKTTIATYWIKLTKFFSWLVVKGYLASNPLKDKTFEFPRIRYDDRKYLERKDIQKILLAVSATIHWQNDLIRARNVAIIVVALYCGLRSTELLSLKVSDVDLTHGRHMVQAETSESQMSRTIPLNSEVRQSLTNYLDERSRPPTLFTTPGSLSCQQQKQTPRISGLELPSESAVCPIASEIPLASTAPYLCRELPAQQRPQLLQASRALGPSQYRSHGRLHPMPPAGNVRADLERMADVDNMV